MEVKKGRLPIGARLYPLKMHMDERGCFTELFRQSWVNDSFIQWNVVRSVVGTLRGVHVHINHSDYLTVLQGKMSIGLYDLRKNSSTYGEASLVELTEEKLAAIFIPNGVAHGFYTHTTGLFVYGVTHYWDSTDELGCHWNDPELQIPWPEVPTLVSERDKYAHSLAELKNQLIPWQSSFIIDTPELVK